VSDPQDPQLRAALAVARELLEATTDLAAHGVVVDPLRLASLLLRVHTQLHALVKRIEES